LSSSALHRTLDQLEADLDWLRAAPADHGMPDLIVRRPGVGLREVLVEGRLEPGVGLVGDTWHGRHEEGEVPDSDTEITIMGSRAVALVAGHDERRALAGDQLYADLDLCPANLPPGTELQIGGALLRVTAQSHTGCGKFARRFGVNAVKCLNSPAGRALNFRGVYARVVRAGDIHVGDRLVKVAG